MRKRFLERILPLLGVGASRSLLVSSRRLIRKTSAGAKTILKGGFLTSFGSLLSKNNKNEKETEDAVKEANIDRPKVLEKSEKSSDGINKVLAS